MRAPAPLTHDLTHRALGGVGLLAAVGAASGVVAQSVTADQDTPDEPHKVGEVVVSGLRPLIGDKLPLSIQDAPQSVNVVTTRLIAGTGGHAVGRRP